MDRCVRQFLLLVLISMLVLFVAIVPVGLAQGNQPDSETMTVTFRVEGSAGTIYEEAPLVVTAGVTVLDVLTQACDDASIEYNITDHSSYVYVTQIGPDVEGQFGVWDGWQYMVNGVKPDVAINEYYVEQNDEIYFYYGNIGDLYEGTTVADEVEKLTLLPEIEIVSPTPTAGEDLQIRIRATYDIYDEYYHLVASGVQSMITGATVNFNGQRYTTDANGLVTIPASAVSVGEYEIRVSKDIVNSYPRLVRTERPIVISDDTPSSGG